jgi:hypothetical protein
MSAFSDGLLVNFLQDGFVTDLLTNKVTLNAIFATVIAPEGIDVRELTLSRIRRREFAVPAFETLRTVGTDEQLTPTSERTRVERSEPRRGRLAWVDVFLDVDLNAKVAVSAGPIDKITVRNLLSKLDPFNTMNELRARLATFYPQSIVDAFFTRFRITSVAQFRKEPHLFLEVVSKDPPAFDPNDPAAVRRFRVSLCVQIQSEVRLGNALQTAKLCRAVLAGEHDFIETQEEYEVTRPHAFLILFPDAGVTDATLPGHTAVQAKTSTQNLFRSEGMLAHFV